MTTWTKCETAGCRLIYDPVRFGPHPLHARFERESEYLTALTERARAGEAISPNAKTPAIANGAAAGEGAANV